MEIKRIDQELRALEIPTPKKIDTISITTEDILVLGAGFEDRALNTLHLAIESKSTFSVLLFKYLPEIADNKYNEIFSLCDANGITVKEVTYDRTNPAGICELICDIFNMVSGRIYLDISGLSRLLIVQLIVGLFSWKYSNRITIFYTEALNYPPTKSEADIYMHEKNTDKQASLLFISRGVFEVIVLPELSSTAMYRQPIRLIAFPSFNEYQLLALKIEIQPSFITLINGVPPYKDLTWRKNFIRNLNGVGLHSGLEEFETCTLKYEETLHKLLDIYSEHGEMEKIIVSPTGSKMQALSVAIFKAFLPDVQIVYPSPQEYDSKKHTVGSRCSYSLNLDNLLDYYFNCY